MSTALPGFADSGWIFDSFNSSFEKSKSVEGQEDAVDGSTYIKVFGTYTRHIVVDSPTSFNTAFQKSAVASGITSSIGKGGTGAKVTFVPLIPDGAGGFISPDYRCIDETLEMAEAYTAKIRLTQTWQSETEWLLVTDEMSSHFPTAMSDTETENDPATV